jgi:quercetin dioxygenase-like cupin family protein
MSHPRLRSIALLVILLTLLSGVGPAVAQEATPASGEVAGTPSAGTLRPLASGSVEVLAPSVANLGFGRITLAPGAGVAFNPMSSAVVLIYVASGAVTFRVEAEMTVTRGAAAGTPVPTEPEAVAADTEFTLHEGDSALFPPAIVGEARNIGTDEATAWVVTAAFLTEAAATPTP